MFYAIRRLMVDIRVALMNDSGADIGAAATLGTSRNAGRRTASYKVAAQLFMTVFIVGICTYVVVDPTAPETTIRLAHTGFGIVMGYWFR